MIDFDIAKVWHKVFALRVKFLIDGSNQSSLDPQTFSYDAICDLDQWIHGPGKGFAHIPGYVELVEKHSQFHCTASLLLKEHSEHHRSSLQGLAKSFFASSEALTAAIDALRTKIFSLAPTDKTDTAGESISSRDELIDQGSIKQWLKELDMQHIELAILVERICGETTTSSTAKRLLERKSSLQKLASLYFETQEIFMKRLEFPPYEMAEHIKEHDRILFLFNLITYDVMNKHYKSAAQSFQTINNEILDHIVKFDLALGDYVSDVYVLHEA